MLPHCSCSDSILSASVITQVTETKMQPTRKRRKKSLDLDLPFSLPISFQESDTPLTQNPQTDQSPTERLISVASVFFPQILTSITLLPSFLIENPSCPADKNLGNRWQRLFESKLLILGLGRLNIGNTGIPLSTTVYWKGSWKGSMSSLAYRTSSFWDVQTSGSKHTSLWQAMRGPIVLILGPRLITTLPSTSLPWGPTQEKTTRPFLESSTNLGWKNNGTMCRGQKPSHCLPIKLHGFIIISGWQGLCHAACSSKC